MNICLFIYLFISRPNSLLASGRVSASLFMIFVFSCNTLKCVDIERQNMEASLREKKITGILQLIVVG
jgi:hypothetical protein